MLSIIISFSGFPLGPCHLVLTDVKKGLLPLFNVGNSDNNKTVSSMFISWPTGQSCNDL